MIEEPKATNKVIASKDKPKSLLDLYDEKFSKVPAAPIEPDEATRKAEEWQNMSGFQKLGRKAQAGFLDLKGGVQAAIGEIMPIIAVGAGPGRIMTPADAMVASQALKQKALETLEKRKEINAPSGDWTDIATMTPMLVGIAASAAAAPFTGGTSLAVIPTIIGQGTMAAMAASVYGNSILEQEEYEKATGKVIPEFSKQSVAFLSGASMYAAGELIGSGTKAVSKVFGDAVASALKESPELANKMMRRFISETPGAAQKLIKLAKVTGAEALKSGAVMSTMTISQDLLANINKYPEDRLAFREIITDALMSFKGGAALGVLLGPLAIGQSEMYHYLRRKKSGINVVQTSDGKVYERMGDHPTDPNKVTVMDGKMNIKDIPRETIEDSFSMTLPEKEKYLDAFRTHQEAMPGIEEAIKRNAVKRQTQQLAEMLAFQGPSTKKFPAGIGPMEDMGAMVKIYNINGEKFFVGTISADGNLAELRQVVNKGDGTYGIKKFMVKSFDASKVTDVPVNDFAQMAFEAYTTAEAPKPFTNKDGSPVDPIERQKAQDFTNKTTKVGEEIQYMGRTWNVEEIGFDGSVKVSEMKDGEFTGETMEIPADKVKEINEDIEEPAVEEVTVNGVKTTAHAGPPVYEKDGNPVSKGYIRGAIRTAKTPQSLTGLRWDNDEELSAMYKAKFPEMVQTYSIGKDEVERDEVLGAINHASDPKDLKDIKINLDPEMQGLLDTKLASLQPVENKISESESSVVKTTDKKAAPAAEGATAAPAVAEKKPVTQTRPEIKTARDLAKDLISAYVKRGDPFDSLKGSFLGKGSTDNSAGIGGYSSSGKKVKGDQIHVDTLNGAKVDEVFSLRELYDEILKEKPAEKKEPEKKVTPVKEEAKPAPEKTEEEYVQGELSKLTPSATDEVRKVREKEYRARYKNEYGKSEVPPEKTPVTGKERQKILLRSLLDNENDVDGAFSKAGYTNIDGFWIEPGAENQFSRLSAETKKILKDHNIVYINNSKERGSGTSISNSGSQIKGIAFSDVGEHHTGYDHTALHEAGHAVWFDLPKEIQDLFKDGNPITEHGKDVKDGVKEHYIKSYGKNSELVGDEDFADLFALNKGDLEKTIEDKKKQSKIQIENVKGSIEKPVSAVSTEKGAGAEDTIQGGAPAGLGGTQEQGKEELTGIYKVVRDRFAKDLADNYELRKAKYLNDNGNVISGDLAKNLSPDYRNQKMIFSQAVHGPASDFAKKLFDEMVQITPPDEGSNFVLMTAGGTGAGKTKALEFKLEKDNPPFLIYDSNMANYDSSVGRIEKALETGKEVDILFVWRDPFTAYIKGVIPRMRDERRSVGIDTHIKTTVNSLANIQKLYDLYKDNENVDFEFWDNDIKESVNPEDIFKKSIDGVELKRRLQDEVNSLQQKGKLTEEETSTLLEKAPAGDEGTVPQTGSGDRSQEQVAEQPAPKPEFAGQTIQYTPFDAWEETLAKARDYARHLFSKEELDAFTASGQLKWNDTPSIVKIIKDKLSQVETKPTEPGKEPTVSTEGITSPGIDITKNEFLILDITKSLKSAYRRGYLDKLGIDETKYSAIKESLYKKRLLLANGGIEGLGRAIVAGLYKRAGINAIQGDAYRNADSAVLKLWDVKPKSDFAGDHIFVVKPTPDHPAVPSFDEWFAKIRFYKSGGTDNYELPDGTKGIGKKDNIEWFKGRYEKFVTKTGPYNPIHLTPEQKEIARYKEMLPKMPIGKKGTTLHKAMLKTIPMLPKLKPGDWYRSGEMGETIMPFIIEAQNLGPYYRVFPDPDAYMLIMSHYYEQNGDLMSDPSMEVVVYPAYGIVVPVSFEQHGFAGGYRQYVKEGKVNEKGMNDGFSFLNLWMKNLQAQGRTLKETDKLSENGDRRKSIEAIENKATAIANEAENVTDRESAGQISEEIDRQIEEIDSQIELLSEHTVPEEYYNSHEYPHRGIEPLIKKDVKKFSQEVAKVLGWEHDTDKKGKPEYSNVNIAPAGGDAHFILWKPGTDLGVYVNIPYEPNYSSGGNYGDTYTIKGIIENQGYGPIMWRLTKKAKKYSGMDNQWISTVNAGELARAIKRYVEAYEKSPLKEIHDLFDGKPIEKPKPEFAGESIEKKETLPVETTITENVPEPPDTDKFIRPLVDRVKEFIANGEKITNTPRLVALANEVGMMPGIQYKDIKELYDAAELALNEFIYEQGDRFSPVGKTPEQATQIVNDLTELQNLLPTETQRSALQVELQQFSTPPALAFLVNWTAGVTKRDNVLEPSAGEGSIAIFAKTAGAKVYVNEYDPIRLTLLKMLNFERATQEDAKFLHAVKALQDISITTVVMNPPFSRDVALGGKMDLHAAEKHLESALNKLEDKGRLVAIVGKGMSMGSPTHGPWWNKIQSKYTVRANILISGDAYSKKGTNFDNRIVVIDKKISENEPVIQKEVVSYSELVDILRQIPQKNEITRTTTGISEGKTDVPAQSSNQGAVGTRPINVGGVSRGGRGGISVSGGIEPNASLGQRGTNDVIPERPGEITKPNEGLTKGGDERRPSGSSDRRPTDVGTNRKTATGITVIRTPKAKLTSLSAFGYDEYSPEISLKGAKDHPTKLVESSAMASVPLPETNYTPELSQNKIDQGALSKAQLEDIILAGNAHMQILPSEDRRGFFLGAGTGYGKGRTIAGIILDNWNKGNKKAVWISANSNSHGDSATYWEDVGGDKSDIITPGKAQIPIKKHQGVIFTTYNTLSSGFDPRIRELPETYWTEPHTSRIQQLVQWLGKDFDGVIVFDESHLMANAQAQKGDRGMKKPSKRALAGIQLQMLLPKAKIVYSSATGATEVSNLTYAQRLGLWGDGTSFPRSTDFIEAISNAGVAGMEIISKDLKSMGLYTAKTLSYDGVEYGSVKHKLFPKQVELYDQVAEAWQGVLRNINAAIEMNNTSKGAKSAVMSAFWGSHQRFFSQIITAMEMPSVIQDIQKQLDSDKAIVVQMVSTGEAQQNRELANAKLDNNEEIDYEELDLSPKSTLIDLVRKSFPVALFQDALDENGNIVQVLVRDEEGNPVENPEAVKLRENLIREIDKNIVLPESPLDMLINTFGVDNVAEVTGRTKRIVAKANKEGNIAKQEESRSKTHTAKDTSDFMDGKKNILIFSKAGGTGASFHSDLSRKNQKQRVHYVLQAGWQADQAIQGFGRSHRSNQRIPPIFKLVTTDLKAQMRFLSSIARRLEQLGALTKGQRDTGGQGILDASFNLESRYARQAVFQFYMDVERGLVPGVDMTVLEEQMALKIYKETESGGREYNEAVVFNTKTFLNRIMSLKVDLMNKVFDGFIERINDEINAAELSGTYDAGVVSVEAEKIKVIDEQVIYTDPVTKGQTYLTTFELTLKNIKRDFKTISFDVQKYGDKFQGFYVEENSGKVYAITEQRLMDADGTSSTKIKRMSIVADSHIEYRDFHSKYKKLTDIEAEQTWNNDFAEYPDTRTKTESIVKGLMLPIWNKLPDRINVKRYIDETGKAHLGRFFIPNEIRKISEQFEVENTQKYSQEQIKQLIKSGGLVRLSNGFELVKTKYQGILMARILNSSSYRDRERLERAGAMFNVTSSMTMSGEFMIPMDRFSEVLPEIEKLYNASVVHAEDSDGNFVPAAKENPKYMRRPKEPDLTENLRSIWDNPEYPKYQARPGAFAGEEIGVMKEHEFLRRAQIMADYTGVPVDVLKTKNELPEVIRKDIQKRFGPVEDQVIPAVYHKGHVWVVMEDTKSVSDLVGNMSHEIFAHHGLPALLGQEQYQKVLQLVYRGMSPVDVINVAYNYDTPQSDWKTIGEEYLGDMAGNDMTNPTLWQKIVAYIRDLIRKMFNISMSKSEIVVLLKKAKENLIKNRPAKEDFINKPAGEYIDAMVAWSAKPTTSESKIGGYGLHVSESRVIEEAVSKGNQDYTTYFGVAKSAIGDKAAGWIEKALIRNDFDSEKALNYLEDKMAQYSRFARHFNLVKDARNYLSDNEPKNPEGLYKVLVGKGKTPDELNFLTWEKPVTLNNQENIINQLDSEGKYDITLSGAFHSGESLYNKIVSLYGSEREASLFLSRAGIDGMRHKNKIPTDLGTATSDGYVVYDNTPVDVLNHIAYKRIKKLPFVGETLARATEIYSPEKTRRNWNETVVGMREFIQDMELPVRKFEEEIIKRGGLQPNDSKPYRDISLARGRQETIYKDYVDNKMLPIQKTVVKIIYSGAVSGENILPYVICKEAIERNRIFRARELDEYIKNHPDADQLEIDEFIDDIADKDYAGVMPFDSDKNGNPLGNFTNPDELAKTVVDEFEAVVPQTLINELWSNIRNASIATLDYWIAGQQLTPEQKQKYLDDDPYFVPLRDWRQGTAKELKYTRGQGFGKSLQHAEGRKSLAGNPLAFMEKVAFGAIGEQVDNEVKTAMLKLLMRNLQSADLYDLATVKKLYYTREIDSDGTVEWKPTTDRPDQALFDSGDAKMKIDTQHERLRTPAMADEHEVTVRRQGGDVVMVFKEKMLSVAQALNKNNYMYRNIFTGKIENARDMNQSPVIQTMAAINNFMKATMTQWNIVFPFTNFLRDSAEAGLTQLIRGEHGGSVIANYNRSFPTVLRYLLGKVDLNNPDDVITRDFYITGGATGHTHSKTPEQLEKDFNKKINRMVGRGTVRGEIKNAAFETLNAVSMWNQMFEDATRVSVYMTCIDLGMSKEDAAYAARQVTIDFPRKGKMTKSFDATYAFWGVAGNSLQKNFKNAKDYPKAFSAVVAAVMVLGYLITLINSLLDDEDPDNDYKNNSPWMRENYIMIPIPKKISGESRKHLSIPIPQFFRGFYSVGALTYELSKGEITVKEAITKGMANFASGLLPVDIGGTVRSGEFHPLTPFIPTIVKPFYEISINRNYMGFAIAKEPFSKAQEKLLANARLGKDNVNPAAKFFTDMLFRWSGGDNVNKYYTKTHTTSDAAKGVNLSTGPLKVPGAVEKPVWSEHHLPKAITNPSFVEHLFKGYTGGTGAIFSDLITTISQAVTPDQEINFKNVPFVNRFIRETPPAKWNIMAEYYKLKEGVAVHKALKSDYTKQAEAGKGSAQIEATEGSGYYEQYQDILDSYDKDISDLSDQLDFNDIEGTKPMWDLMQQCINDIKALKEQYKMK